MATIYTKTGDAGKTTLSGRSTISKDDLRIEIIGELDELSSCLGIVLGFDISDEIRRQLLMIQKHLYEASSFIAGFSGFDVFAATNYLEKYIDEISEKLPELADFVVPGGESAASNVYFARAVCRRAERRLVLLSRKQKELMNLIPYINRLSDFLFVVARYINHCSGIEESLLKDIA